MKRLGIVFSLNTVNAASFEERSIQNIISRWSFWLWGASAESMIPQTVRVSVILQKKKNQIPTSRLR